MENVRLNFCYWCSLSIFMEIQTDTKFFDGLESEKHGYMHSLEKKFSQIKSHSRLPTARYFDDWSSEWTLPILATTESTYKKKNWNGTSSSNYCPDVILVTWIGAFWCIYKIIFWQTIECCWLLMAILLSESIADSVNNCSSFGNISLKKMSE